MVGGRPCYSLSAIQTLETCDRVVHDLVKLYTNINYSLSDSSFNGEVVGRICSIGHPASSEPTEPYADSFAPTETLLRVRPELRWYRQRKDPAWVVGEQRQLYFTLEAFRRVVGDDGDEDDTNAAFFTSSKFIFGTTIFLSRGDSAIVCSGLS
ncbi:hypothetical protein RHMOL_Rhmol04G0049500 [Rhododendron molle]|uniref:Uncharacterized protein n=1 Tax=Rhododendron molle TaxID=49168 RepID=A0ACC0NXK3_RHOML|nr:hypothetical protein RHMOL_Rhmol04G0049500 [Rhododendron molle]